MARVFDMTFDGVKLVRRDFSGENYGTDGRQFAIIVDDLDTAKHLEADGVRLWWPEQRNPDEPVYPLMYVKVSYRFGDPFIGVITPDGKTATLNRQTVGELDSAWIKDAELHVHGSTYDRPGRSGTSVYLDSLVVTLMSNDEKDAMMEENRNRNDPVREKYREMFGW